MASTTIAIDKDAPVDGANPGNNLGGAQYLTVRWNTIDEWRVFVEPALGGIPAQDIVESAKLRLYETVDGVHPITIACQAVSAAWVENTITWANQPGVTGAVLDTQTVSAGSTWYEWDVTTYVKQVRAGTLTNNGLRLKAPSQVDAVVFQAYSSDHSQPELPELVVVHFAFSSARIAQIAWG